MNIKKTCITWKMKFFKLLLLGLAGSLQGIELPETCRVSGDPVYRVSGVGKGSGTPKGKHINRKEVTQLEL